MSLPKTYNKMFIDHTNANGIAYNDAETDYGVTITTVADPTKPHWRVVGVHHLTNTEGGHNNAFVDVLDAQGVRIHNASVEAKNSNGAIEQVNIHKALPDPGLDFVLFKQDRKSIYVTQEGFPSDSVDNLHTDHDDEGIATRFHHAFYAVFQFSPGTATAVAADMPSFAIDEAALAEPSTPTMALSSEESLTALLWETGNRLVQPFDREAALYKEAQAKGLGEHLTVEYEIMHNGQAYLAQVFELGLVYVPIGQWDQVQVLESGSRDIVIATEDIIIWDHHITGFYGSRWAFFEKHIQPNIADLAWPDFNTTFTASNPQVTEDQGVVLPQKQYVIPRMSSQPGAPASQPLNLADGGGTTDNKNGSSGKVPIKKPIASSEFVQIHNKKFHIHGQPKRFMGVNIRGLVHYGQDGDYFAAAPVDHRQIQLQGARDMNAQLIRVFLPHKNGYTWH